VNIARDQIYQLSLYVQMDATVEQKTDSKVTIQCASQVTKNIVFEQNSPTVSSDFSRKVDSETPPSNSFAATGSSKATHSRNGQKRGSLQHPVGVRARASLDVELFAVDNKDESELKPEVIRELQEAVKGSWIVVHRGRVPFMELIEQSTLQGQTISIGDGNGGLGKMIEVGEELTLIVRTNKIGK